MNFGKAAHAALPRGREKGRRPPASFILLDGLGGSDRDRAGEASLDGISCFWNHAVVCRAGGSGDRKWLVSTGCHKADGVYRNSKSHTRMWRHKAPCRLGGTRISVTSNARHGTIFVLRPARPDLHRHMYGAWRGSIGLSMIMRVRFQPNVMPRLHCT